MHGAGAVYWREDQAEAERAAEAAANEGVIFDERQRDLLALLDEALRRDRLSRAARRQLPAYDAARCASVLQGHCVLEGALLFSAWAKSTPRWVYVLIGADGALYCGSTNDLRRRVREHRAGVGAVVTAVRRQRWFLLHAERFPDAQGGFCAELALLRSEALQRALLAERSPRADLLHARHGVAVPWLGLGSVVPEADAVSVRDELAAKASERAKARERRAAKLRRALSRVPWLSSEAELEAEVQRRLNGGASRFAWVFSRERAARPRRAR